jgi:cytochrome c
MLDSFEINKILGAVLGTLLIMLSLNIVTNSIFAPKHLAKPGYEIAVTEQPAAAGGAAVQEEPIEQLLAKANPEKGATVAKKCLACHDFAKGGPNKVGPNLYGIINRDRATHEGFAYSEAMKKKGGKWTIQDLNLDGLRRDLQGLGPRRPDRLSQHARRQSGAAADGTRARS